MFGRIQGPPVARRISDRFRLLRADHPGDQSSIDHRPGRPRASHQLPGVGATALWTPLELRNLEARTQAFHLGTLHLNLSHLCLLWPLHSRSELSVPSVALGIGTI